VLSGTRRFGPLDEEALRGFFTAGLVKATDQVIGDRDAAPMSAAAVAEWLGVSAPAGAPATDPRVAMPAATPVTGSDDGAHGASPAPASPAPIPRPPVARATPTAPTGAMRITHVGPAARWPIVLWVVLLFAAHMLLMPGLFSGSFGTSSLAMVVSFLVILGIAAGVFAVSAVIARRMRARAPSPKVPLAGLSLVYVLFAVAHLVGPRREPTIVVDGRTIEGWYEVADELNRQERWDALAEHGGRWLLQPGDHTNAHQFRGDAFVGLQRYDEAIAEFSQAAAIDPLEPFNQFALCRAYGLAGKRQDAVRACNAWTKLAPNDAVAWNNLGYAYEKEGSDEESISAYQRAVAIDPKYSLAWSNLAVAYRRAGYPERAEEARTHVRKMEK
jgi:hypothetical protein